MSINDKMLKRKLVKNKDWTLFIKKFKIGILSH